VRIVAQSQERQRQAWPHKLSDTAKRSPKRGDFYSIADVSLDQGDCLAVSRLSAKKLIVSASSIGSNDPQSLMSTLQYPLYDFLATVPSCPETNTLAVAIEIFEKEQCDRLVVVNQQQCPIALLYSARLVQKLLASAGSEKFFNLHQPLSTLGRGILEPIQTVPATESLEKFSLFWRYQKIPSHQNLDWAIIDSDGKFLGLVDSSRLLQFLVKGQIRAPHQRSKHKSLVQLLERLPWPLMLQTAKGDVLTQNLAWWQQLGVLKDPEGIRQQVETILAPVTRQKLESSIQKAPKHQRPSGRNEDLLQKWQPGENTLLVQNDPITEELPNTVNNPSSRCFLDGKIGICTCVVEVQNGQERIWQFAKIPLVLSSDSEQEPGINHEDLWLVLATDVTEQQQLYKELAAKNADLIQLNRLKDEFLACISHELKTPLTAVLGLSRLLVDQQLGELNERQARYAGLIHQSGRHLMSVVNDILDLTRMETGQMELTPVTVKIRAVCDRALSEVKAQQNQHNKTRQQQNGTSPDHRFSLTIEPGLDQIVADELRLRQMLVHLLSNAFKFTETSGEIGLRVSRWEGWIAFTVWDTGIGIPEHQQHLIFQKFQQLENPLTRQFEGTGLGLVLTRALARLHGGDVSFLSREGKGSQFTLLLPPSPPKTGFVESEVVAPETTTPRHRISSTPQHQPTSSQRLVLVVEAVARYIEELTENLKGLGYRVVIARSGTEAVEKARRLQPKAIFLNPLLPLLSGWDVLTLLKSDSATRHIPVIVTATGAEKEQAYANRANGFLSLPVEHQVLSPLLERLCSTPELPYSGLESNEITPTKTPLRILRLVNPELGSVNPHPSLQEHRVIEVDDVQQAEILARVWQFDVVLLDVETSIAQTYLQQLAQYPQLVEIPLVTCDVATTLAASQIPGLTVFPYLTPLGKDNSCNGKTDALLSVLQIASGFCCPPNILVVDLTMLQDLLPTRLRHSPLQDATTGRGSEWFQALIQYLQTAGFKAAMGRCWAEVLQQIRHQSVDLLLICLGESTLDQEAHKVSKSLRDLPFNLPPILVIDQRLNQVTPQEIEGIATQVLPRSISMEDLLNQINQALG